MVIKSISIKKLHGKYDKYVEFDPVLTYLYGANGSGKTTVLNILAAIITGKLYNLCEYRFKSVVVEYEEKGKSAGLIDIQSKEEKINRIIIVKSNGEVNRINDFAELKEKLLRQTDYENIEDAFFELYPFAREIKKLFNYLYLPLNRFGSDEFMGNERIRYSYSRRVYYEMQHNPYNSYLNYSLQYVAKLIRDSCMRINIQENKVNDSFRKDVLTSMISVSESMKINEILDEIKKLSWNEVQTNKTAYIRSLKEIGVYDERLEREIELFFRSFKSAYDKYKEEGEGTSIAIDFAWQYAEFQKIRKIAELANKNEKNKEEIRKPRELFISLIDDFFSSSGSKKETGIDNEGRVTFKDDSSKLNLNDLSSGEKQIVITFASMIFGLKGKETGIFIVDEPEASLHLAWQKKYVPAILKTGKNIQLIFATHSPELIGAYRDKAYEL